jgi:4-methyl-5(b-hydroxyethyl)-thiazole monophosphate biosynthesis
MNALVAIADGTEEMEAVIVIDVLRRAGTDVMVASVGEIDITASRGVVIKADALISECVNDNYDLIVVPGGMPGAEKLRDSEALINILKKQDDEGRLIGSICAAPAVALLPHGLLSRKTATCHPAFRDSMPDDIYSDEAVTESGNIITSKGPGTAMLFALKLVERLHGQETADNIAGAMCCWNG